MPRYILCPDCAPMFKLHPENKAMGLQERRIEIAKARRPPDLAITTTVTEGGKATRTVASVPVMRCDGCNGAIEEGTPCTALTYWRGSEPQPWEKEYAHTPT